MCNHNRIVFKENGDRICKDCNGHVPPLDPNGKITSAPFVLTVAGVNMTVPEKLKYWGIKDARTGEGITKDTNVLDPIGLTKKNKGKKK